MSRGSADGVFCWVGSGAASELDAGLLSCGPGPPSGSNVLTAARSEASGTPPSKPVGGGGGAPCKGGPTPVSACDGQPVRGEPMRAVVRGTSHRGVRLCATYLAGDWQQWGIYACTRNGLARGGLDARGERSYLFALKAFPNPMFGKYLFI